MQSSPSSHNHGATDDRFLAVLQEFTDVFWILTSTYEMQEISSSWQAFTGQEGHTALGQGWQEAVHPADRTSIEIAVHTAISSAHTEETECHVRKRDGFYSLVRVRVIPVPATPGTTGEVIVCGTDITRQELAGKMGEALAHLAIKTSRVGLWDWNYITKELTWSEQEKALFGWPSETEVTYKRFLAAVHPDDRERIEQINKRGLAEQREFKKEYRVVWPDGSVRWLTEKARGVFDENGQPLHLLGETIDMMDLKQAEKQDRGTNQQIMALLESITDGILHFDTQWRYIYVNEKMEEMIGSKQEDLLGRRIWDVIPELLNTPFEYNYRKAMEMKQMVHFEAFHPLRHRWLDIHAYPSENGLSAYLLDVTERKQVEEALRKSEARFRGLVESNLIGINVSNLSGTIQEANDAFLRLIDYTQEDLAAGEIQWQKLTPPEYQEQLKQAIDELLTTGRYQPLEQEYLRKDGTRVLVLAGGTLFRREGSEPLAISFVVDQTAHQEIARQKDLFLGIASHELKTPLAALRGTLQLVQRRMKRVIIATQPLSPEMDTFFDSLTKSVANSIRQIDVQTRLINDLLDVSRINTNTLKLEQQRIDLVRLVHEVVEDLQVTVPERSIVLTLPENTTVEVLADEDRIGQVVTNYITNALRYSSPDQPIYVGITPQELTVRVWVRDRGPGLSEDAQKEIWQSFHQVKGVPVLSGSGKGLGLGLYICKMLVAQHHGEVGVESNPGEGSTFWFTLPLAQ